MLALHVGCCFHLRNPRRGMCPASPPELGYWRAHGCNAGCALPRARCLEKTSDRPTMLRACHARHCETMEARGACHKRYMVLTSCYWGSAVLMAMTGWRTGSDIASWLMTGQCWRTCVETFFCIHWCLPRTSRCRIRRATIFIVIRNGSQQRQH